MGALIRKMTEDIGQSLAESLAQPVENRAKPSAVGAEIVAVEHDVHDTFGGASAAHMIPGEIDGPLKSERCGQYRAGFLPRLFLDPFHAHLSMVWSGSRWRRGGVCRNSKALCGPRLMSLAVGVGREVVSP